MLLYSIIARSSDGIVLVEATTAGVEGNHPQITNQLVQKLIANPSLIPLGVRKTFVNNVHEGLSRHDTSGNEDGDIEMKGFWNGWGAEEIYYEQESLEHFFHVQRDESVYFICISSDKDGQQHRRNYCFLNDIQKKFNIKYTPKKIVKLNAYGLEKQFKTTINSIMHDYNTTGRTPLNNDTQASNLNAEVESIKKIMGNNIHIMMRNEANFENLVETTDDLLEDSKVFTKRGRKLKKVMKKKAWCYKVILIGFAFLTIYLMAVTFCGFDLTCAEEHYY